MAVSGPDSKPIALAAQTWIEHGSSQPNLFWRVTGLLCLGEFRVEGFRVYLSEGFDYFGPGSQRPEATAGCLRFLRCSVSQRSSAEEARPKSLHLQAQYLGSVQCNAKHPVVLMLLQVHLQCFAGWSVVLPNVCNLTFAPGVANEGLQSHRGNETMKMARDSDGMSM